MAPSFAAFGTTGGIFSIIWCRPSIGNDGAKMPLSAFLTEGNPHANTNTLRIAHGSQARITTSRGCFANVFAAAAGTPAGPAPTDGVTRPAAIASRPSRALSGAPAPAVA